VHCSHISTLSNIGPGYLNILKNNSGRSRIIRHGDHTAAVPPHGLTPTACQRDISRGYLGTGSLATTLVDTGPVVQDQGSENDKD
jgi:hypothetical protein